MYTLLLSGALLDNVSTTASDIGAESVLCAMIFFIVVLLAALTVMNMLTGVLCEVVSTVAATEKEAAAVGYVKAKVREILKIEDVDRDGDGLISKGEFVRMIEHRDAAAALQDVGVDVLALVDHAEVIFQSDARGQEFEKKIDFNDFMNIVLQLRGGNTATVRDIEELRKFVHSQNTSRNNHLAKMEERQRDMQDKLASLGHTMDRLCFSLELCAYHNGSPVPKAAQSRNLANPSTASPPSAPQVLR